MNVRPKIERLGAVLLRTGLSRSKLYELRALGDFPEPVKLSPRAVGFLEHEVDSWIADRAALRGSAR